MCVYWTKWVWVQHIRVGVQVSIGTCTCRGTHHKMDAYGTACMCRMTHQNSWKLCRMTCQDDHQYGYSVCAGECGRMAISITKYMQGCISECNSFNLWLWVGLENASTQRRSKITFIHLINFHCIHLSCVSFRIGHVLYEWVAFWSDLSLSLFLFSNKTIFCPISL